MSEFINPLKGKTSPTYFEIERLLGVKFDYIYNNHFNQWRNIKYQKLEIELVNGKKYYLDPRDFKGCAYNLFWYDKYILAYIKEFCINSIDEVLTLSKKFSIKLNKCLDELQGILVSKSRKIYQDMAIISAILLSNGRPEYKREYENISRYVKQAESCIFEIIEANKLGWINSIFESMQIWTIQIKKIISFIYSLIGFKKAIVALFSLIVLYINHYTPYFKEVWIYLKQLFIK